MNKRIFKDTGAHLPDYCRPTGDILARLGEKWVIPIFGHLKDGPLRFSELAEDIEGISERMLTMSLRSLERDGLIDRSVLPTAPPRVEYALSERGKSLMPALFGLHAWAEEHNAGIEQSRRDFDAASIPSETV